MYFKSTEKLSVRQSDIYILAYFFALVISKIVKDSQEERSNCNNN